MVIRVGTKAFFKAHAYQHLREVTCVEDDGRLHVAKERNDDMVRYYKREGNDKFAYYWDMNGLSMGWGASPEGVAD